MFRGLNFLFLVYLLAFTGCGEKSYSLKIIGSELLSSQQVVDLDNNYKYIKLQVNSNPFSYLALGYNDLDDDGFVTTVWYSNDKHILRIKFDRLHSISAVSPSWYGMNYISLPNNDFSKNSSYQRVRFSHDIVQHEIIENVYISESNNPPNGFLKFCGIGDAGVYVSEVSVDQYGNKLKSFYGLIQNDTEKQIKCVFQELDKENMIKWIFI